MFTMLKEMNIFLSWKTLKTLWQRKKLLPLSQCFQMSSAAANAKTSIYGVKG